MPITRSRDVFRAISDPTRRRILRIMSSRKEGRISVSMLAKSFPSITEKALYHQLNHLHECGLVTRTWNARAKNDLKYTLSAKKLKQVSTWVETITRGKD